jgi:hypothetical protein
MTAVLSFIVTDMLSFTRTYMTIISAGPVNIPADMTLFPVQTVSLRPGHLAASNAAMYTSTISANSFTNDLRICANCHS